MTEMSAAKDNSYKADDEFSVFAFVALVIRWRVRLLGFVLFGALLWLVLGILAPRLFVSRATFLPQETDASSSGLAMAASRLGINLPDANSGWGPPIYVELLQSETLLEPIAKGKVLVAEEGNRQVPLEDLLGVNGSSPALRTQHTITELRRIVLVGEDKKLGAVRLRVATRWPSVSLAIANLLLQGVNEFNVQIRQSQAVAERRFVEVRAAEAEAALRAAEDRLQLFLQRNRDITSSGETAFERDRLQRDVNLRQDVYSSLVQNREEARIREVRDTPVITVIESPKLAVIPESRKLLLRAVVGALLGGVLGILVALLARRLEGARRTPTDNATEFFEAVHEVTPRFLRRQS